MTRYGGPFEPPVVPVDHAACPHGECVREEICGLPPWCLRDRSTWAEEFEPTAREQVRRALLQSEVELAERRAMGDHMGTRGAFNARRRISAWWDEVK